MRSRKKGPTADKNSMEFERNRKLTEKEIHERQTRFVNLSRVVRGLLKKRAADTRKVTEEIKGYDQQLELLGEEIAQGWELTKQRDLFAEEAEEDGAPKVPQPVAQGALGKVAEEAEKRGLVPASTEQVAEAKAHKGGNGHGNGNGKGTPTPVGPEGMAARSRTGKRRPAARA